MKTAKIITATAGLALLLGTAAPALAAEAGSATSVGVEATTEVTRDAEHPREGGGYRLDFEKKSAMASSTREQQQKELRTRQEREQPMASSSEMRREHKASSTQERMEKRVEKIQEKAGSAIEKRIKSLMELKARFANIKLLSADQFASFTATLDAEIASLTTLKAKIDAGTATSTLKTDVKSITQDHRVFSLVEPVARISVAASRIKAVASQLEQLSTKMQERITAASIAGTNVADATAALTHFNAKVADAKVQADAAVALVAGLTPDNGDKTVQESNKNALEAAHTKLVAAEKDLAAARHDAATIHAVVKGKGEIKTTATTTTP